MRSRFEGGKKLLPFFFVQNYTSKMNTIPFISEIYRASVKSENDPYLIAAVVKTESDFNQYAYRYEPHFKWIYQVEELSKCLKIDTDTMLTMQKSSWGAMQIMGSRYYEMGGLKFASELMDIVTNLNYGCKIITQIKKKYQLAGEIYAAYNAGSVRIEKGVLHNQKNVDRFIRNYNELLALKVF